MPSVAAVPPSPCGAGYVPFGREGRAASAAPNDGSVSARSDVSLDSAGSKPTSPVGVFVSVEEVAALKQWADEREAVIQRAAEVEALASARDEEMRELRLRLAASEHALRALRGGQKESGDGASDARADRPEAVACQPCGELESARRSRSRDELESLGEALSTRRRASRAAQHRQEAASLREQLRGLRKQQSELASASARRG
jgi:hypothetical protein